MKSKPKFDQSKAFHSIISTDVIEDQKDMTEKETPKTMGRPKSKKETKKRVTLMILPSLYEKAQQLAYVDRKSVSELMAECLESYISENKSKLKEYDKIKND